MKIDLEKIFRDFRRAASLGVFAKACTSPQQAPIIIIHHIHFIPRDTHSSL